MVLVIGRCTVGCSKIIARDADYLTYCGAALFDSCIQAVSVCSAAILVHMPDSLLP